MSWFHIEARVIAISHHNSATAKRLLLQLGDPLTDGHHRSRMLHATRFQPALERHSQESSRHVQIFGFINPGVKIMRVVDIRCVMYPAEKVDRWKLIKRMEIVERGLRRMEQCAHAMPIQLIVGKPYTRHPERQLLEPTKQVGEGAPCACWPASSRQDTRVACRTVFQAKQLKREIRPVQVTSFTLNHDRGVTKASHRCGLLERAAIPLHGKWRDRDDPNCVLRGSHGAH